MNEDYVGPLDQVPTDPIPPPESDEGDAKPAGEALRGAGNEEPPHGDT